MNDRTDSEKYRPQKPEAVDPLDYYKPNTVVPSPPDARDYKAREVLPPAPGEPALPEAFALPEDEIMDQDGRGSCAAFSACRAARRAFRTAGRDFDPSEEAEYALACEMAGWLGQDNGSYPRHHMAIMQKVGLLTEADAPYLSQPLTWAPSPEQRQAAAVHQTAVYFSCETATDIKRALLAGSEVQACFVLRDNFSPDSSGNIPMPSPRTWGGHAMTIQGWDDHRVIPHMEIRGAWKVKNQWGDWGDRGSCWISYAMADLPWEQGGLWWWDTWAVAVALLPEPDPEPTPEPQRTYGDGVAASRGAVNRLLTLTKLSNTVRRKALREAVAAVEELIT